MKILVITLSGIGDAIMFTPALQLLSEQFPNAEIDILTMFKGVADIFDRSEKINKVYHWDFVKQGTVRTLSFLRKLRRNKYDVSITVFPANRREYNILSFMIGARKRIGTDYLHLNRSSLPFLLTDRTKEDDSLHNVEENCHLVELIGVKIPKDIPPLHIDVLPEDEIPAQTWLMKNLPNSDKQRNIGIHAGSATFKNQINKRWDWKKYADLSILLNREYNARILIFGGPEESELNEQIVSASNATATLVKVPSLMASIALMKRCDLFISNDSGLMHVASALQIPLVAIFGYTSHVHTHPWHVRHEVVRHDLPCSPCFYFSPRPAHCQFTGADEFKCIRRIEVSEVFEACKRMM
ncbi:MAG: lipopolysaccharide heptosyltransferase II [Ignavibacteriae bacterium]|nr:lipopolysaccharide heptosyltransferase II [Ignavibacteriota bacterium]